MVIVRELENFLNDVVDESIMWFKRNKKEDENNSIESVGRREFLGTGIKAAAGFVVAGGVTGLATKAMAGEVDDYMKSFEKKDSNDLLPPGIRFSRDPQTKLIWMSGKGINGTSKMFSSDENLLKMLSNNKGSPWTGDIQPAIDERVAMVEPAIYFIRTAMANLKRGQRKVLKLDYHPKDLKFKNPALHEFSKGIDFWYKNWGDMGDYTNPVTHIESHSRTSRAQPSRISYSSNVEFHLSNSIYMAAYPDMRTALTKAKEFRDERNIEKKTVLANNVTKQLMSMKGFDKKSLDPNSPYNRHVVANWAATWLTNHHWVAGSKKKKDFNYLTFKMINDNIEIPLRKHTYRVSAEKEGITYFNNYI